MCTFGFGRPVTTSPRRSPRSTSERTPLPRTTFSVVCDGLVIKLLLTSSLLVT
ncbi:unnamed protein product [Nippostrongylus brasiliensis]|uniref:Uncharacterized protein n=1 Tax=Nippostrongylus brasiliensis TaxID=27835 RepID=A0A0N4XND7_NIPBR|nr:unnamed protein product [Nippostrongylus brasiliensis]